MASKHPFRFGVQFRRGRGAREWIEAARRAEALGYSTLSLPDHFTDQFAPIAGLTAAAMVTEKLRISALVLDNDYRHPVVLAKELATMDVLSEGRLDIGLGAGWLRTDYEQAGMEYDGVGVRIDRMIEGLAVIRGLMAGGPFSFEGRHYHVEDMEGTPLPVQRPHPPILLGGGGRRMLSIAAREADIVNVNFDLRSGRVDPGTVLTGLPDAFAEKISWIREAAGDRFDSLEISVTTFVTNVTHDRETLAQAVAGGIGAQPSDVLEMPNFLIGSVDELVHDLELRRERYGVSYVFVPADSMEDFAPVVARLNGT